jgi:TonB family protein
MTVSYVTALVALFLVAATTPLEAQDFTAYTVAPELRNLANIRPMVDSAATRLVKAGTSATVLLQAMVRKDGSTTNVSVQQSSGNAVIDSAAINVVQSMNWKPGGDRDGPKDVWISLPVVFRPKDIAR